MESSSPLERRSFTSDSSVLFRITFGIFQKRKFPREILEWWWFRRVGRYGGRWSRWWDRLINCRRGVFQPFSGYPNLEIENWSKISLAFRNESKKELGRSTTHASHPSPMKSTVTHGTRACSWWKDSQNARNLNEYSPRDECPSSSCPSVAQRCTTGSTRLLPLVLNVVRITQHNLRSSSRPLVLSFEQSFEIGFSVSIDAFKWFSWRFLLFSSFSHVSTNASVKISPFLWIFQAPNVEFHFQASLNFSSIFVFWFTSELSFGSFKSLWFKSFWFKS